MNREFSNMYDVNTHLPEIYDQVMTENHDVKFLIEILENMESTRMLEPFCGNGRILIPLVEKGYNVTGIDIAKAMLNHLRKKIEELDNNLKGNVELIEANVLEVEWPKEFDFIILGGNCLYELATPEDQKKVIEKAYNSLKLGGLVFIDNDNMEGLLDESWCNIGVEEKVFPSGQCSHGVKMQGFAKTIWVDREKRLWRAQRRIEIEFPDGTKDKKTWVQQKHPVSAEEIEEWLNNCGFEVLEIYAGTEEKKKFTKGSKRATFLAKKVK